MSSFGDAVQRMRAALGGQRPRRPHGAASPELREAARAAYIRGSMRLGQPLEEARIWAAAPGWLWGDDGDDDGG